MTAGYDPKGPIFISYRQSDGTPYAEALDTYLRAGGLVPWRDFVDLAPGETAQRVREAFEEGISNAVFIVTEDLVQSQFVPDVELPALLGLDSDTGLSNPFHVLVLNTVADPASDGTVADFGAPDRILRETKRWPPKCSDCEGPKGWVLRDLKQFAYLDDFKEMRQLYADLLDSRLSARVAHLADKEVTIQTQTRPEGNARSRRSGTNRSAFLGKDADDPYDLTVRLRQDKDTGVPSEAGLRALQETLPLMVDGLYAHGVERVRISGAGHNVLLWALGAALPQTRMRPEGFVVVDLRKARWYDQVPNAASAQTKDLLAAPVCTCLPTQGPPDRREEAEDGHTVDVEFIPPIDEIESVPSDRVTRAAVLFDMGAEPANEPAFRTLAAKLRNGVQPIVVRAADPERRWIPSGEGARLARKVMSGLRSLVSKAGVDELHVMGSMPAPFAALLGRRSNTLNLVLYEWGTGTDGNRAYVPVVRIQPGMPGGPITEVFAQGSRPDEPVGHGARPRRNRPSLMHPPSAGACRRRRRAAVRQHAATSRRRQA